MNAPPLFESIRLADGRMELLPYHQARVDRARRATFGKVPALKLAHYLERVELPAGGLHKVRVAYDVNDISHTVTPYAVRPVASIRLVNADHVRYRHKFADRRAIEGCFNQRGECDDVLMVQRGHVTDCSYANVALYDGTHWYTPAWPLLPGTRRAALIELGVLRPSLIRVRDLGNFQKIRLINGMMEWEEGPEVAGVIAPSTPLAPLP